MPSVYYLTPYVGIGTDDDPYRPDGADDVAEWSSIDLSPPGPSKGLALLAVPSVLPPKVGRIKLSETERDTVPAAVRRTLGNRLGLSLDSPRFDLIVLELLTAHARKDGSRWRPLRPGRDGVSEIHLGGLLWRSLGGGATITESFNKANSDILGPDLTWTEVSGDLDIVSNAARKVSATTENFARAEHDLATDDHYAQIVITAYGSSPSANNHEIHARWSASAQTFYRSLTRNDSTNTHRLFKRVAGVDTQLGSSVNETPPSAPVTIRIEANGSSITYIVNGTTKIGPVTDTEITGTLRCGFGASGGGTGNTFDNFEAGDLVVAAIHELPRATETDTARALSVAKTVTLPRATSTDVARDLVASRTYELPRASETDSARELIVSTADVHQLTRAVETDTARALTAIKTVVLPRATETDTARALTVTGEVLLPRALETNLARALSGVAPRRPARRRALISTVAFTIGGKEIHIDGWRARSRINYGYEHLTGTLQGADARGLGQGDPVIAWIESTGEAFWEGRLALDPTVHDGEAPIACAGDGVVLEKSGGRALLQTRDMSLLVDEANLPHDYTIDPGISVSTEPGMLHMEVGANVTPTGAGHGLLLWAPGQRFTRYVLGRIRLQAHGTTGHKLQVLGGLGPAGALTEIADHSLTSGDTSNYATNIAGDYDLLVFRFDPSTTTASGPRWVDIVDVRINGFGTADTLGASELVAEMGRRAGLDVSKVTANGLNVLPRDHRDGPWRTLLEDVAVFTGWQFGVYDGLHFGPYGDRTWTVYRSYGGDPELDLLEKFNRFVIHYPTANGVPAEVVRDSSPNPLPPGVVNVFEETISEVQPDDSFPTAMAAQLDADLSSDRRAGQVHVVAAHDDAGRRQLLLMRPGHHLRFGDWGPYESRTFPVHDLEASAEGLMLGTNAPARVDRLIANTMLERARSVPFRFTSHAPR